MNFKLFCIISLLTGTPTAQHAGGLCCKAQSKTRIIILKQPAPKKRVTISPNIQIFYISPRINHCTIKPEKTIPTADFWAEVISGNFSYTDKIRNKKQ